MAGSTVGSPLSTTVVVDPGAERHVPFQVLLEAGDAVRAGVAGREADGDAGPGDGHEGVGRAGDPRGVEPGDRDGGPGPQPLDDWSRADPVRLRRGAGLGPQPFLWIVHVRGGARDKPGHGRAAVIGPQRGKQPRERHDGVRDEAAPHAGVDGVGERPHLDVHPHQAARLVVSAGTPMSQFPESAMTMTSAASWSRYWRSRSGRVTEATSSSPSMKNRNT